MAQVVSTSLVQQVGSLFEGSSIAGLSDRQLLERDSARRDPAGDAAFAALVGRHGPMVLDVCRQLLGDRHHAEDAFQAVFLVLARKAPSLREPELLGNWLYGVALRTARKARGRLARHRQTEADGSVKRAAADLEPPAYQPMLDREQAEALHREIDRLPRAFRLPVVLCYFEGLTLDEAAKRLRCPAGTLRSRLARAREKLRHGLVRRGVALPAAALGAVLAPRSARASVSSLLCDTTTRAATAFAAPHATAGGALSASAAAMAREVLHTMLLHKLRLAALSLLLLAVAATGAGVLTHSRAMKEEIMLSATEPVTEAAPRAAERPRPSMKPDAATTDRMTVAGRVLDPDGKPVKGAVVDLVARPRSPRVAASAETEKYNLMGQGESSADGQYRIEAPRTASIRFFEVMAVAAAPGYGLSWAALNPDAEQPTADLKLQPEHIARARLVEVTGEPARGVEVSVLSVWRASNKGTFDGVSIWPNPQKGIRAWPRPVTSDNQGRFTITGISLGVGLTLNVRDLRYARQDLYINSSEDARVKETTIALEPARIIEGRVLAADTGQPIPGAVVSGSGLVKNEHAHGIFTSKFRADAEGRFIMNPIASDSYTVGAFPTGGEPYLVQQDEVKWTKGTVRTTHDIKLRRGVLIRGRVIEVGTDRPLPASSIQFMPIRGSDDLLSGWEAIVASKDDGSFQIAVPAGKGHLLFFGPTGDYVLSEIGAGRLYWDRPGGYRHYAHAIIPYEVKAADPPRDVATALRPGVTIKARVEGPGGETITDGFVLTTLRIEAFNPRWRGDYKIPIRDGRFELHGLAPEATTRIHVLDSDHKWGTSVEVSGKQVGQDLTIRLQPCGQATARFVGLDGRPIAGHQPHFEFVATPGRSGWSQSKHDQAQLAADAELIANVDRKHYWNSPRTDPEGRITFISLIPGALYRICDFSTANDQNKGVQVRKDFTVKSGEALDLGDILIEKPHE